MKPSLLAFTLALSACEESPTPWSIDGDGKLGFQSIDNGAFRVVDVSTGEARTLPVPSSSNWLWLDHGETLAIEGLDGTYTVVSETDASLQGVLAVADECGPTPEIRPNRSGTRVAIAWRRRCAGFPVMEVRQRTPGTSGWQVIGELGNPDSASIVDANWGRSHDVIVFTDVFDGGHSRAEMHRVSANPVSPKVVSVRERSNPGRFAFPRPSPDGRTFSVASGVTVWGPGGRGIRDLSAPVVGLEWHPSGEHYSAVTADGLLWQLEISSSDVRPVGFFPTGSSLIGWSADWEHVALVVPCDDEKTSRVVLHDRDTQSACLHRLKAAWSPTHSVLVIEGDDRVFLMDASGQTADLGPGRDAKWAPTPRGR